MNLAKQSGKGDILFVNFNQDHRSAVPPAIRPQSALESVLESARNPLEIRAKSAPHVARFPVAIADLRTHTGARAHGRSCLSVGTRSGFKIYNCNPFGKCYGKGTPCS